MTKNSALFSDLRQLCCLGLGGAAIMPGFLRMLRPWVGSNSSTFLWADPPDRPGGNYKPSGLYTDLPAVEDLAAPRYLEKYCDTALDIGPSLSDVLRSRRIDSTAGQDRKKRLRSGIQEEVYGPMDAYHGVFAPVHDSDNAYGMLYLFRSERDPDFSRRDHERLTRILPFLAHAMHRPCMDDAHEFTSTGASGLFILDAQGKLLHFSDQARRLIFLAGEGSGDGNLASRLRRPVLPPELSLLCNRLRGLFRDQETDPPVFHRRNRWGKFVFRAYFLNGSPENPERDWIGVTVEYHAPLRLKRWEQISMLPLSAKQKEAGLLFAEGLKQAQIAERMGVSLHTAIDYIRQIYTKLDVHNREELLARMESAPCGKPWRNGAAMKPFPGLHGGTSGGFY
jgi:DNA-binding CsgD family transcriptional regulator